MPLLSVGRARVAPARTPGGLRGVRGLLLAAVLAVITGCESVPVAVEPVADPQATWRAHLAATEQLDAWRLSGRVGIETRSDSVSASVSWVQNHEAFRIRLSGAFGQGMLEIAGDGAGVTLRDAQGDVRTAGSADVLLRDATGWQLPVSGLRHWVLGRPDPTIGAVRLELDAAGRMSRLDQSGWAVEVDRYERVDGLWLPARIVLEADGLSATLVMRSWQLN